MFLPPKAKVCQVVWLMPADASMSVVVVDFEKLDKTLIAVVKGSIVVSIKNIKDL